MKTTIPANESPELAPKFDVSPLALAALANGVSDDDVHAYVTRKPDSLAGLMKEIEQ